MKTHDVSDTQLETGNRPYVNSVGMLIVVTIYRYGVIYMCWKRY